MLEIGYQQMYCLYVKPAYLGSTDMNYPIFQFSKHSHNFLNSYGHFSNCAISGAVAGTCGNR